jgi:phage gp16-like protein
MSRSALNSSRTDNRRASELAKIHIAKKRLRLDDDTYRAIIARVCGGKTSAADLTQEERGKLLNEFNVLAFSKARATRRALTTSTTASHRRD